VDEPAEDFTGYVARSSASLARTAYLLTGDRGLAEDLLQEALASVAQRWSAVLKAGDPEPYVRRVMVNKSIDAWRRRRARLDEVMTGSDAVEAIASPDDDHDTVERRLILRDALMRVTPRQRAVLVLRFYEDLSERAAAGVLGCSVNTVKSQTRLALQRLREVAPEIAELFGPAQEVDAR
jgi:RNA polymerase sigma-70 factor (sigma-E family)